MPYSSSISSPTHRFLRRLAVFALMVACTAWLVAWRLTYRHSISLSWSRLAPAGTDVRYRSYELSLDHGAVAVSYYVKDSPWSQWTGQGLHNLDPLQAKMNGFRFEGRPGSVTYPDMVPPAQPGVTLPLRVLFNRLGFQVIRWSGRWAGWPELDERGNAVFPIWSVLIVGSLPVGIAACQAFRHWRRARQGRCVTCNYDLRHSPGGCPECGAKAIAVNSRHRTLSGRSG